MQLLVLYIMSFYLLFGSWMTAMKIEEIPSSNLSGTTALDEKHTQAIVEGIYHAWVPELTDADAKEKLQEISTFFNYFPPDMVERAKQKFIELKAKELASKELLCTKICDHKEKTMTTIHTHYDGRQDEFISGHANLIFTFKRSYAKGPTPWCIFTFEELLLTFGKKQSERLELERKEQDCLYEVRNSDKKENEELGIVPSLLKYLCNPCF